MGKHPILKYIFQYHKLQFKQSYVKVIHFFKTK